MTWPQQEHKMKVLLYCLALSHLYNSISGKTDFSVSLVSYLKMVIDYEGQDPENWTGR